ncbi:MAG: hypothetical protein AB1724_05105 [Thermodesulfobacteriota bacterium]
MFIPRPHSQAACLRCHESTYRLAGAERLEDARALLDKHGCYACHYSEGVDYQKKFAPPLNGLRKKLADRRWLLSWLSGPSGMRPGTVMPDFHLPENEIQTLAAFLLKLPYPETFAPIDLGNASVERGRQSFHRRGCIACHVIQRHESQSMRRIPVLFDAGIKLKPEWIWVELEDPRRYNPDARIPLLILPREETLDIIAYLVSETSGIEDVQIKTFQKAVPGTPSGEQIIRARRCYACHRISGFEKDELPPSAGDKPAKTHTLTGIHGYRPGAGNTQTGQGVNLPDFGLNSGDTEKLLTLFFSLPSTDIPEALMVPASPDRQRGQAGHRLVADYACGDCHLLEDPIKPRAGRYVDRTSLMPPRLDFEGEKVQPQWLAGYLASPSRLRIWLEMQMPLFYLDDKSIGMIIDYFRDRSGLPVSVPRQYALPFDPVGLSATDREMGLYRFRNDRCMQCHPVSAAAELPPGVSLDDLAVDLMLAKNRLTYEWTVNFLKDPVRFAGARTRMPYVYFSPEGLPRVSDAEFWMEKVARFLFVMEEPPAPLTPEEHRRSVPDTDWLHTDY